MIVIIGFFLRFVENSLQILENQAFIFIIYQVVSKFLDIVYIKR